MLGDTTTDVVPRNHHGPVVAHRVEEAHQPDGQPGDRRHSGREFAPGPSKARKVHGDRAQTGDGDFVKNRLPDAAPIGAVEQKHHGPALAGG